MSISDGSQRPSFKDSLKSALSPREPVQIDKDAPNPLPGTVKAAGWLALVSGVVNAGLGVLTLVQRSPYIQSVREQVEQCRAQGVGFGESVAAGDTSQLANTCRNLADFTEEQYAGAASALLVTAIALLVVGLVTVFAGWGLIRGAVWARRLLTVVGVLLLVSTMLQLLASPLVLLSAMLLLVALALLYVGKGATYFIRAKAQGVK